jgi:hypothetical protein
MADVTINDLSPITPTTGLFLPASDSSTTGKVTLSQVCGVMTSTQITTALGYTPYNSTNPDGYISGIKYASAATTTAQTPGTSWVLRTGLSATFTASVAQTVLASVYFSHGYENGTIDARVRFLLNGTTPAGVVGVNSSGFRVAYQAGSNRAPSNAFSYPIAILAGSNTIAVQVVNWASGTTWGCLQGMPGNVSADVMTVQYV